MSDLTAELVQWTSLGTRDEMARQYGSHLADDVNWAAVNRAIIERWSLAGLKYIKRKAWAFAVERERLQA